jgi:lysophospholipase L1-like esterase
MMMLGNSLHILCFGDSLTAGFSLTSPETHPYEGAMKSSLEKAFPSYNITTDLQGLSGDQVKTPPGGFLTRMDILCEFVYIRCTFDRLESFFFSVLLNTEFH